MKLIHCLECHDTISLLPEPTPSRTCVCGKSSGCYPNKPHALDSNHVVVYGPCKVIGFGNTDLAFALEGKTAHITAFIIPDTASTIIHTVKQYKKGMTDMPQSMIEESQVTDDYYCDNCDSPTPRRVIEIPCKAAHSVGEMFYVRLCLPCMVDLQHKLAMTYVMEQANA